MWNVLFQEELADLLMMWDVGESRELRKMLFAGLRKWKKGAALLRWERLGEEQMRKA